jgi:glycerol kinase
LSTFLLAIDQGTTSTRAIVFDAALSPVASAQLELTQHYPGLGLVEHDAAEIWSTTVRTVRTAMEKANIAARDIAAIGVTNQRETTLLWDRVDGRPIHNAIVWQDRRTAQACAALRMANHEPAVAQKTGLLLDPYFSATKVTWLLDNVEGARAIAESGRLAFGTIDTFLVWQLTGGRIHATDATNASRTLLLNLHSGTWDDSLADLFRVPMPLLPDVCDSAGDFGLTEPHLFGGSIRIMGLAGDQQAAMVGQGCFATGMMKATYGTGCFALLNTGDAPVLSRHRLLTTIGCQLAGRRIYALEGAIFVAGAAVQWLRDGLGVISSADDLDRLAAGADPAEHVYLVPAFVGLGAPWWDAEARGAIFGLSRKSGAAELARAVVEAVGYQTRDLLSAMQADWPAAGTSTVLRVDGGMSASDATLQFLADILDSPVDRPVIMETTALGAAYLAGFAAGICPNMETFARTWKLDRRFTPNMEVDIRERKYTAWQNAVRRTLSC